MVDCWYCSQAEAGELNFCPVHTTPDITVYEDGQVKEIIPEHPREPSDGSEETLRQAITDALNLLGPPHSKHSCGCEGCEWEKQEVLQELAWAAGMTWSDEPEEGKIGLSWKKMA